MFSNKIFFDSKKIELNRFQFLSKICQGLRPLKPDLMPDCYWEIVSACFNENPDDRPSFSDIIQILNDDKFAIHEFGMETDIEKLHEYQRRISQ